MLSVADIFSWPAVWGVLGAFIYAGPRWATCIITNRELGKRHAGCTLEFTVALVSGGIAAAAFSSATLAFSKVKDLNAISAMVGLLANPVVPVLVKRVSNLVGSALAAKVDDKLPGGGP